MTTSNTHTTTPTDEPAIAHLSKYRVMPAPSRGVGRHVLVVRDLPEWERHTVECHAVSQECQWWVDCEDCRQARRRFDPRLHQSTHQWIDIGDGDGTRWCVPWNLCVLAYPPWYLDFPDLAHLSPGRYTITRFWLDSIDEEYRVTVEPTPLASN